MCLLAVLIHIPVSNGYLPPLLFLILHMRLNILPHVYILPPFKNTASEDITMPQCEILQQYQKLITLFDCVLMKIVHKLITNCYKY